MMLESVIMAKNSNMTFQWHHAVEFVLQMLERSAGAIPVVVMAVCWLYEVFGKEEELVGSKRSHLDRVKYFNEPFHKKNYYLHDTGIHIA